ncbi:LysR family transcriptional regulator (plasmid) [Sinorhizobium meliloti WSM1022]|jgi:DNA-binding transcriptional LysR family regulator|uniref:LysR family transcriptional regulator n=1 Tax=Rhizobium meliloti TaxID=382 RepID=UPI0002F65ADF|nr:LysR family transcriptional regulator [Sinorhizobium meliloti]ASJ62419.1 LysR family transcriptional regulator [Sinorhizobium meliloti]ASP67964.1 LysR family transcriptional regulator [Sinorhizobium meliloti]ASQ13744.1 LysR family transcriptional regulator [Sinorhizobium meliloti]MCK3786460.1 LysR family transcriptional regulator [Sinorhizobium meliloti]MCK3792744.1 LysR family transcriptional regulator [Sinorhizobium meliloti]
MDRWQAMRIFVQVVESGGFAPAAKVLHMSPPSVTRAVAKLEDLIGTRLLVRTTRSLKLTAAGEGYVADCRRILAEIAEAEANAAGSFTAPAGLLTVTAPALFGRIHVLPVILDFLDHYPAMQVKTIFVDRVTNLVDEGLDVAIRIASLPASGLVARRIGSVRQVLCGSPDYFACFGEPGSPQELARHRIIGREGLFGHSEWLFGRDNNIRVPISPRLICNTNDAVLAAAVAGWGLSRFQSYQVAPDVIAGRLKVILADYEREPVPIHIVHAEGRMVSARVRAFVDFAAVRFRRHAGLGTEL